MSVFYCLLLDWAHDDNIWLAGKRVAKKWRWTGRVDGPLLYADWAVKEPNSWLIWTKPFCTMTYPAPKFTWDDNRCDHKWSYVCERPGEAYSLN